MNKTLENVHKKYLKVLKKGPGLLNYEPGEASLSRYVHGGVFSHNIDVTACSFMHNDEAAIQSLIVDLAADKENYIPISIRRKDNHQYKDATFLHASGVIGIQVKDIWCHVHTTVPDTDFIKKCKALSDTSKSLKITSSHGGVSYSRLNELRTTNEDFYPYVNMGKLSDAIYKSTTGIVILSGEPGTGKSRIVEHILCKNKSSRSLYFADASSAANILSPSTLDTIRGSIVVIEEGDNLIKNRAHNQAFIPAFLDATSGITGETYGVTFVITTNLPMDQYDPAITRKGRLIYNQEFRRLDKAELTKLKASGCVTLNTIISDGMTLADIFSEDENSNIVTMPRAVGFK